MGNLPFAQTFTAQYVLLTIDPSNWILIVGVIILAFLALRIFGKIGQWLFNAWRSKGKIRVGYIAMALFFIIEGALIVLRMLITSEELSTTITWLSMPIAIAIGIIGLKILYNAENDGQLMSGRGSLKRSDNEAANKEQAEQVKDSK